MNEWPWPCVVIALGYPVLILCETPVFLPIMLLAPWYFWSRQSSNIKKHLNKISLVCWKRFHSSCCQSDKSREKPRLHLNYHIVLTQKNSCSLLLTSVPSSAIIENSLESYIIATFSCNTWAPMFIFHVSLVVLEP